MLPAALLLVRSIPARPKVYKFILDGSFLFTIFDDTVIHPNMLYCLSCSWRLLYTGAVIDVRFRVFLAWDFVRQVMVARKQKSAIIAKKVSELQAAA